MSTQKPVLELRGIVKTFNLGQPNETEVLHGIDLTLLRGEFCSVIGPSGSGKSTLLNIVGLLDRPTYGSLEVCQQETTLLNDIALTKLRGHNIGFVFQYHHLISAFTAIENVMVGADANHRTSVGGALLGLPRHHREEAEGRNTAMELLTFMGIADRAGDAPYR